MAQKPEPKPVTPRPPATTVTQATNALAHCIALANLVLGSEGSVHLVDGTVKTGSFKPGSKLYGFKDEDGSENAIVESGIAFVDFARPKHAKLNGADHSFDKADFAKAKETYTDIAEDLTGDLYLKTRLMRCDYYIEKSEEIANRLNSASASANHLVYVETTMEYIAIFNPKKLDSSDKKQLEESFSYAAHMTDATTRTQWQATGKELGAKLEYNAEAPQLLQTALDAFKEKSLAKDVAKNLKMPDAKAFFTDPALDSCLLLPLHNLG